MHSFAQYLKNKRKSLGLTQAEMVKGVNITRFQYSKIENNKRKIYLNDLFAILEAHKLDKKAFFDEYFSPTKKVVNNYQVMSHRLNSAFYHSNLKEAKKIKSEIEKLPDASQELKYHAILVIAGIKGTTSQLSPELKKKIIKLLFKDGNWTQDIDSLRIFGNSMPLFDTATLNVLMQSILEKYANIEKLDEDMQIRISIICINYLYNTYTHQFTNEMKITLNLLDKLPAKPVFTLYRLLETYFKFMLNKNNSGKKIIKIALTSAGYGKIVAKLK